MKKIALRGGLLVWVVGLCACGGNGESSSSAVSISSLNTLSSVAVSSSLSSANSSFFISSSLAPSSSSITVSSASLAVSSSSALSSSSKAAASSSSLASANSLVLQEEAAGYCGVAGVIDTKYAGYTGAGFIDTANSAGATIRWQLNASESNVYRMTVRYANGGTAARAGSLSANDNQGVAASFTLGVTGAWTTWSEETRDLTLNAGANSLVFTATGSEGLANIDSITISGAKVTTADCPVTVDTTSKGLVGFATLNGGTTGGKGGQTVTVSNFNDLKTHAESATPTIILVNGTITNGVGGGLIRVAKNKSIIGVGSTAFIHGVGFAVQNNNIIFQNLKMTLVGLTAPKNVNDGDIIGISGAAKNIWIDHCELYSEDPSVQTNIDKYDGLIDIKGQTGFITLSWNYLHDHHKGGLVGSSDSDLYADRKITLHHNYYKNVRLRAPMYRGATGHFFNNYIVGAKDASEIRANTCVRIEKNYYESLNYSIYTTSDSPGSAERIDNVEVKRASRAYPANCTANIPYNYASALTTNTHDVKTVVPLGAGVGKL
ncbi:MAG: carbohydrate-binding protein [Marinagarivorans sp.]|nr:carbohydrate-binding protein [Marinagarivorans sp.]